MNTNVVVGTYITTYPASFNNYSQIIQDQNSTIPKGIPIIIPNSIREVDEDDEMISEIISPECFEGNIISGWSDAEGNEGVVMNGIFDVNETENDFYYNDPEFRNCILRYFDYQNRAIRAFQENN